MSATDTVRPAAQESAVAGRSGRRANTLLQAARQRRGWTQEQVRRAVRQIAQRRNIAIGSPESLKTELSRWENGHAAPAAPYRTIFRELYGLSDQELGFGTETPRVADLFAEVSAILDGQLRAAEQLDLDVVEVMAGQTHQLRLLDRRFGAAVLLDEMSGHVDKLATLLTHAIRPKDRRALAGVLADAGALAGWQALDAGAVQRAWRHFTSARTAALEAERPELFAHSLGEQAYALLDLGRPGNAIELLDQATRTRRLPPRLRAWLAAARGEMLAAAGDEPGALKAFDTAQQALPDEPDAGDLPFLALDQVHLTRWRGHALARLARPDAVDQLRTALAQLEPAFVRAACGIHVDLAYAHSTANERHEARREAQIARTLAIQLGSERHRRRIGLLRLPDAPFREQPQ